MDDIYWANKTGDELAAEVKRRVTDYDQFLASSGRYNRLMMSYKYFYNFIEGATQIQKDGSQGEILRISLNAYRSYLNNLHILITQSQIAYEAEAENSDIESEADAVLGKQVVEYYLDTKKIDMKMVKSVLNAMLFGEEFLETGYSIHKGKNIGVSGIGEEGARIEKAGDLYAKTHSAINTIRDVNLKDSETVPWYIFRTWRDRWEFAAQHPEHRDFIMQVSSDEVSDWLPMLLGNSRQTITSTKNDQIPVYHVYHADTAACEDGREILVCGERTIDVKNLTDTYEEIPVARMAAGDMEGTFLPYSSAWDLLPVMQAKNAITTARLSNALNMAFNSIWCQDPDLDINQTRRGFGLLTSQTEPKSIALAQNAPTLGETTQYLDTEAQAMTGLNSVARGLPEGISGDKSGAAYALILSTAIQFQTDIQNRYKTFASDAASNIISVLKRNSPDTMTVRITGKSRKSMAKEFNRKQLDGVKRVRCKLTNPLLSTTSGKITVADSLQAKYPNSVPLRAYCELLETGNLDAVIGQSADEGMTITSENEQLYDNKAVPVLLFEQHWNHIQGHLRVISTPEQKRDPKVIVAVQAHIAEHLKQWMLLTQTNPQMLQILQLAPLVAPTPPVVNPGQNGAAPTAPAPNPAAPDGLDAPGTEGNMVEKNLPNLPSLPKGSPPIAAQNYAQVKTAAVQ